MGHCSLSKKDRTAVHLHRKSVNADRDMTDTSPAPYQQWQGGKLRVIEYASRTFSPQERRWCVTHNGSVCFHFKQFRCYLLGRHFEVRVDNMAEMPKMKNPTGQAARYLDFVSNFSFDIKQRDGSRHINGNKRGQPEPAMPL